MATILYKAAIINGVLHNFWLKGSFAVLFRRERYINSLKPMELFGKFNFEKMRT